MYLIQINYSFCIKIAILFKSVSVLNYLVRKQSGLTGTTEDKLRYHNIAEPSSGIFPIETVLFSNKRFAPKLKVASVIFEVEVTMAMPVVVTHFCY